MAKLAHTHTHTYSSSIVCKFVLPLLCRYCPGCKEHQQASKKLDLWRLPEILIIHLKRFSYSRYTKNKLETFVDFPIHDLDLSKYFGHRCQDVPHNYRLYAISNHYGSLGGGHYTAYVYVSSLPPLLCLLGTSVFYIIGNWQDHILFSFEYHFVPRVGAVRYMRL